MADKHIVNVDDMPKVPLVKGVRTDDWVVVIPPSYNNFDMLYSKDDYRNLAKTINIYNSYLDDVIRHLEVELEYSQRDEFTYMTTIKPYVRPYILCNFQNSPILANACRINITGFDKRHDAKRKNDLTLYLELYQEVKGRFKSRLGFKYDNDFSKHVFHSKVRDEVVKANTLLEKYKNL